MNKFKTFLIGFVTFIGLFSLLFWYSLKSNESVFFSMASSLLGREPRAGDGAFHIPIGWFLMLIFSALFGTVVGVIARKVKNKKK